MKDKITEVKGTITLADGSTSEFSIVADLGWQQWGALKERLGRTGDALEAMAQALDSEGLLASDDDDEEESAFDDPDIDWDEGR